MKSSLLIIFCMLMAKFSVAQNSKKNIDYQYFRDNKTFYAYNIYTNKGLNTGIIHLDFYINAPSKNIDKLYINDGNKEYKLKFKQDDIKINTDNKELSSYSLKINLSDISNDKISCTATIIFKLDDGKVFSLPFNKCLILERIQKN